MDYQAALDAHDYQQEKEWEENIENFHIHTDVLYVNEFNQAIIEMTGIWDDGKNKIPFNLEVVYNITHFEDVKGDGISDSDMDYLGYTELEYSMKSMTLIDAEGEHELSLSHQYFDYFAIEIDERYDLDEDIIKAIRELNEEESL